MLEEISTDKKILIDEIFPYLSYQDLFPHSNTPREKSVISNEVLTTYHNFAISSYDHWLKEGESVVNYPFFFNSKSFKKGEEWWFYQKSENNFRKFYNDLYKHGAYLFYLDNDYVELKDKKLYMDFILQDIREMRFHRYIFPDLGLTITGGFDLTHIVHANRKFFKKDIFNEIAKCSDLYILK